MSTSELKSPLVGYENAEPLPTTFNADGKSYYNPPAPRSAAYDDFPAPIESANNGFDFHSESSALLQCISENQTYRASLLSPRRAPGGQVRGGAARAHPTRVPGGMCPCLELSRRLWLTLYTRSCAFTSCSTGPSVPIRCPCSR